jgi:hypothetical protein
MFIMGTDDDEDDESAAAYGGRVQPGPAQRGRRARVVRLPWAVAALLWTVAFAAVWVAGGAVTARDSMCVACHPDTVHSRVEKRDPHADVQCVACHEQGGRVGALTYMVRAAHFIEGLEASYRFGPRVADVRSAHSVIRVQRMPRSRDLAPRSVAGRENVVYRPLRTWRMP